MPTPVYRFRLAEADQKNLIEMAKLYGASNTSVFLREMVSSLCSGDQKRVTEFVGRLITKMGEQLLFDLSQKVARDSKKPAPELPTLKRKGKRRPKRGRTT